MSPIDDSSIVDLYLHRDQAAIAQTQEKYGRRLRALAYGIVNDLQTSEECENDTYLNAWNAIPPHQPKNYLYPFLACITRRIALNFCRDRSRLKRSAFISQLSAEMEQCIPAPDDIEDILNYNFRRAAFFPDDDGNLYVIRMNDGLLFAEKLGDYPVITAQEAKERLVSGQYQTSVPAEFPGAEYIVKTELVYRTGRLEEVLLPYYRFYVLLPDDMNISGTEIGLDTYGAYYVPAITDEYISDMPTYDGIQLRYS